MKGIRPILFCLVVIAVSLNTIAKVQINRSTALHIDSGIIDSLNPATQEFVGESFSVFFEMFAANDSFQIARTVFPLEISEMDVESGEFMTRTIDQFDRSPESFSQDSLASTFEYDAYSVDVIEKSETEVVYRRRGIDNGIYVEFVFEKINSKWYFIRIVNSST